MANGKILYRGPSLLDGSDIVVIATLSSENRKTGGMIQTWILRADMSPNQAVQTGEDRGICGNCPHRGPSEDGKGRSCYVSWYQAPTQVYKAFVGGKYPHAAETNYTEFLGRMVRFGSYGDPAAVPIEVWENLARLSNGRWTGYTHQWRDCSREYARFLMASCETEADRVLAKSMGYRTFRTRSAAQAVVSGEFTCPASEEAGKLKTCETCGVCFGTRDGRSARAKDVVIVAHGGLSVKSNYTKYFGLTVEKKDISLQPA